MEIRTTLSTKVYDQIKFEIGGGGLSHLSVLPKEISLAEEFGVSRKTVRSALQRLQEEGLVEPKRRVGWVVQLPNYALAETTTRIAIIGSVTGDAALAIEPLIKSLKSRLGEENLAVRTFAVPDLQVELSDILNVGMYKAIVYASGLEVPPNHLTAARAHGIAVVNMFHHATMPYDTVCDDEAAGMEMRINHLVERGHQKIAFVGTDLPEDPSFEVRRRYYRQIMTEKGLDPVEIIVQNHWVSPEQVDLLVSLIRNLENPITAFVGVTAPLSYQMLFSFYKKGLRVPDDVSIVSMGSDEKCIHDVSVNLNRMTMVRDDAEQIACVVAERVVARLQGDISPAQLLTVCPKFVEGDTVLDLKNSDISATA